MAADSKTKKKLGHNLTIIHAALLPKRRFRTTTGRFCKVCIHWDRSLRISPVSRDRARGVGRRREAL